MTPQATPCPTPTPSPRFKHPVGPKLRKLLYVVFALFALLGVNSIYLAGITFLEWRSGDLFQNWFYLMMFLVHLLLGIIIVLPVIIFGLLHMRNTHKRPNRRAVRVGYALFATALVLLGSGIVLTRIEGLIVVKDPAVRSVAYWTHVIAPIIAVWLYLVHRLAGRRIKWRVGATWATVAAGFAVVMIIWHTMTPKGTGRAPQSGDAYYQPSLSRTSDGQLIRADVLDNNQFCLECHADVHETWSHSAHKFASFNNPAYLASIRETRAVMKERDGTVNGSRFCAGCHDPVPFFSGAFEDPIFDDPAYDLSTNALAQAGITCTVCHSITEVGDGQTVLGNGDYIITEPTPYPFTYSDNDILKWINRQLIKAKPAFHKATYLKPLHQTTEFCGVCHKVHLPVEVNAYKWLRGQNHYDPFNLSGVSGQGVQSFYYPPEAETNCNGCHMPLLPSDDFAAQDFDDSGSRSVHDHMFPSANTALSDFRGGPDWVNESHRAFLEGVMRVDIFGVRRGVTIDAPLEAPIRPMLPAVAPGETILLETVIRTVKMGHTFTQGTADSNEVWMDVTVTSGGSGGRVIGRSGGMRPEDRAVDPWSHFVNAFVIDKDGNRISRRNAQDIFTALYNNQIPPGAADVLHYLLRVPNDAAGSITIDVKLQFRKFDTEYMQFVHDDPATEGLDPYVNDLTVITLAHDTVTLPVKTADSKPALTAAGAAPPEWQRWNDYGIGLLRREILRQAEEAFAEVERLGRPDGPLNLARVHIAQGDVDVKAPQALRRARDFADRDDTDLEANEWTLLWLTGRVNVQNSNVDEAIENFRQIIEGGFKQAEGRNFDFSRDYRLLIELADALHTSGLSERGDSRAAKRRDVMIEAKKWYRKALAYDPENADAHYGAYVVSTELGEDEQAKQHFAAHEKYRVDDNARDTAIANARAKYDAANRAAERVVIFDLQRPGAYELPPQQQELAGND